MSKIKDLTASEYGGFDPIEENDENSNQFKTFETKESKVGEEIK